MEQANTIPLADRCSLNLSIELSERQRDFIESRKLSNGIRINNLFQSFDRPGILMGNITSLFLIIVIWKPYFLYSQGFKIPVLHYWMGYIKHLLIILLPGIVCYHLYPSNDFTPESSFTHWILYGMILISTYGILTCSLLYLFTPGIRAFAHRILKRHH